MRDPGIAAELSKAVGHRVQLHFTEHPGVPTSCFAETRYFVDKVTVTDAAGDTPTNRPATLPDVNPAATPPPPPSTAPAP